MGRLAISHGRFSGIGIATIVLFAVSPLIAPGSLSRAALISMLPFAAILAISAIGKAVVVLQRGLDLFVPGMISIAALFVARYSHLDERLVIPGILIAIGVCAFNVATFLRPTPARQYCVPGLLALVAATLHSRRRKGA